MSVFAALKCWLIVNEIGLVFLIEWRQRRR